MPKRKKSILCNLYDLLWHFKKQKKSIPTKTKSNLALRSVARIPTRTSNRCSTSIPGSLDCTRVRMRNGLCCTNPHSTPYFGRTCLQKKQIVFYERKNRVLDWSRRMQDRSTRRTCLEWRCCRRDSSSSCRSNGRLRGAKNRVRDQKKVKKIESTFRSATFLCSSSQSWIIGIGLRVASIILRQTYFGNKKRLKFVQSVYGKNNNGIFRLI